MAEIIPSIIAKTFEEVKQKIVLADDQATWVQLDIMDGKFVVPTTWDIPDDLENLDGKTKIEVHLMVKKPEEELKLWMDFADRILVHAEATDFLVTVAESFDGATTKLGVALKIDTPLSVLEDIYGKVDHVQLMSIDVLGHYGAKFDDRIYGRIIEVKKMYPEMKINVDGGITLDNAPKLIAVGADALVVGSAIWDSGDPKEAIKLFQSLGT